MSKEVLKAQHRNFDWGVHARQFLWVNDSAGYPKATMRLTDFPGAYFYDGGYLKFDSREEFEKVCGAYFDRTNKVNFP